MLEIGRGDISDLLQSGQFEEGLELEAKAASGSVPRNAWESISAFANTKGGALVLGVKEENDEYEILGVNNPSDLIRDLHTSMRDPQKISFPVCDTDDIWVETIGDKNLIVLRINRAPRRYLPIHLNGDRRKAYFRNHSIDTLCTPDEIQRMEREASPLSYDATVLSLFTMDDFDRESVRHYREMSQQNRPNLPHHSLEDKAFLQASRAWGRDREQGTEGPTVAGLLMLGTETAISEISSNHIIDYRRVPSNATPQHRWLDRDQHRGNLLTAWMNIYPRLVRELPVPFRLRGAERTDQHAGQNAIREAFVNLLVHADYRENADSLVIVKDDRIEFSNPGDSWADLSDLGVSTAPERRNPCLATLFQNIGLAEQASSGFIAIKSEWDALAYQPPIVDSDSRLYRFSLTLPLLSLMSSKDREWLDGFDETWGPAEEIALLFARQTGSVDNATLRQASGQHLFDASQTLRSLRDRDYLVREGMGRNSRYRLGPASFTRKSSDILEPNSDILSTSSDILDANSDNLESGSDNLGVMMSTEARAQLTAIEHLNLNAEQVTLLLEYSLSVAQTGKIDREQIKLAIVNACSVHPLTVNELANLLDRKPVTVRRYLNELVAENRVLRTMSSPNHPGQRYQKVKGPVQIELPSD